MRYVTPALLLRSEPHDTADRRTLKELKAAPQAHWRRRFNTPLDRRKTRAFNRPDVPDVRGAAITGQQHSSTVLRPADVVVYVGNSGDPEALFAGLSNHLPEQRKDTLHAVMVVGPVCGDFSR